MSTIQLEELFDGRGPDAPDVLSRLIPVIEPIVTPPPEAQRCLLESADTDVSTPNDETENAQND